MRNEQLFPEDGGVFARRLEGVSLSPEVTRNTIIGLLLVVALFSFEVFNFDTTRYALANLLGDVTFVGIPWAAILAIAFCAIDFAGLAHLFAPEESREQHRESWYLMGAWLMGATMNALMTWWAVNLTLLNNQLGNEVLSRQQILNVVPPFVALLVWLTRILFIGAFSVAGDHFFREADEQQERDAPMFSQAQAHRWNVEEEPVSSRPLPDSSGSAPKRESRPNTQQHRVRHRPSIPRGVQQSPMYASARQRHVK